MHGYVQGRFTDQEGTPDRLEIRRARLIVTGEPASNLSYRFQVDFAKSPYLMDAALTYKLSTALSISAGQMKSRSVPRVSSATTAILPFPDRAPCWR